MSGQTWSPRRRKSTSGTSGTLRPRSKTPRRPAEVPDSMCYYLHLLETVRSLLQDGVLPISGVHRRRLRPGGGLQYLANITAVLGHGPTRMAALARPHQAPARPPTSSRRPRPPPPRPLLRLVPCFRAAPTRAGFYAPFGLAPSHRQRCRARKAGPCWMRTASCTSLIGGRGARQLHVRTSDGAQVPGELDGVGGGCGDRGGDGGRGFLGVCAF